MESIEYHSVCPDDGIKSYPIFPKLPQNWQNHFFYKSVVLFKIAQIVNRIFRLLLKESTAIYLVFLSSSLAQVNSQVRDLKQTVCSGCCAQLLELSPPH